MRLLTATITGIILSLAFMGSSLADDGDVRKLIECSPGKNLAKLAGNLSELKADRLDTINTNPSFTLEPTDGGVMPVRIFVRHGEIETDLQQVDDGEFLNVMPLFLGQEKAELCIEDPSRVGQVKEKDGAFEFSMAFNMNFLHTSGSYSLDELKDGLKDGKAALKKMVPGPVALVLPKMSHVYVEYDDETARPEFSAIKDGNKIEALDFVQLGKAYMIAMEDLKDMKIDSLEIKGGAHTVSPSLSPKRMAKIMGEPEP